jgi:hypothetical protein
MMMEAVIADAVKPTIRPHIDQEAVVEGNAPTSP